MDSCDEYQCGLSFPNTGGTDNETLVAINLILIPLIMLTICAAQDLRTSLVGQQRIVTSPRCPETYRVGCSSFNRGRRANKVTGIHPKLRAVRKANLVFIRRMKMKRGKNWNRSRLLIGVEALALVFAVGTRAQVQTTTTTTSGKATKTVSIERGEVVLVQGNDLVVKMADGKIRHFPNVPESTRVSVNGKLLSVHDLKPGMKLERTITTTTTPENIKTVQTVTGTVWNVMPPNSVILTLDDGKNQRFKIPKGQK